MEGLRHNALASSTHKTYERGVQNFLEFCDRHGGSIDRTASVDNVALWLTDLSSQRIAPSTASTYLSALKNALIRGLIEGDPVALSFSKIIKEILEGFSRTYRPSPHMGVDGESSHKSLSIPFDLSMFARVVAAAEKYYADAYLPVSDPDKLIMATIAVGLGGALRPGEYLRTDESQHPDAILTIHHLTFSFLTTIGGITSTNVSKWDDFRYLAHHNRSPYPYTLTAINIHLICSKTDQRHRGEDVLITDRLCLRLILQYLRHSFRPGPSGEHNILPLLYIRPSQFRPAIQYSALQATKDFRDLITRFGIKNADEFTLKSLRSGAIESMRQAGASEVEIMLKGRWTNLHTPTSHYLNRPTHRHSKPA